MQLLPFQNSKYFGKFVFILISFEKIYHAVQALLQSIIPPIPSLETIQKNDFITKLNLVYNTKTIDSAKLCHQFVRLILLVIGLAVFYFLFIG